MTSVLLTPDQVEAVFSSANPLIERLLQGELARIRDVHCAPLQPPKSPVVPLPDPLVVPDNSDDSDTDSGININFDSDGEGGGGGLFDIFGDEKEEEEEEEEVSKKKSMGE